MYGNGKIKVDRETLVVLFPQGLYRVMFYVQSDPVSKYKETRVRLLLYLTSLGENIMHHIKINYLKSLMKNYGNFGFCIQRNDAIMQCFSFG